MKSERRLFGYMIMEEGVNKPPFLVPRKLNMLINAKKISRYAALFPARPPRERGFLFILFKKCPTICALPAPYQVPIWFE